MKRRAIWESLSRRQRDIVPLIERNLSDKEIAQLLGIADQTVKNTLVRLRKKLNAKSRLAIARIARKESL